MNKIFVIEHLEPELWPWCIIEYKHISKIVGKDNLMFTNIKFKDSKKLEKFGKVINKPVSTLFLHNACILDPESCETLSPRKSKDFSFFIFGGILGDYPPKKRTRIELTNLMKGTRSFNIGKDQMSTDNAVYTVKQIISGKSLEKLKFKDNVEVKINRVMSTQLPYKYNVMHGKPLISRELIKFIKERDNKIN